MYLQLLLLLSTLFGGLIIIFIPKARSSNFQFLLIFSGGYLFASTMLHLLPELFSLYISSTKIGLYILIGFFFQRLIELFSGGIEHGHNIDPTLYTNSSRLSPFPFVVSIVIHAFLDGTILCSPTVHHHHANSLLIGIILHKVLEAFALAGVLTGFIKKKRIIILYLLFFSLASPIGLWVSNYCSQHFFLSGEGAIILAAVVTGNFLYISTTILFESSPEHHLNTKKFIASLAGSGLASILEFLL